MKTLSLTLLFTILILNTVFSQSFLTIQLNNNLDPSKIKLFYTDGPENKFIDAKFSNNIYVLNEKFKSKYFRLIIMYPDKTGNFQSASFLVSKKKASIKFKEVKDTISNKLNNYSSENVIEVSKCNEYLELKEFTKIELNDYNNIRNKYNLSKTDSNLSLFNQSSNKLALKELQYIKKHGNKYFYFWTFTQSIVSTLKKDYLLELYEIFNTCFPKEFKNSYEGEIVKKQLEGNLYLKVGMQSPQFTTTDYLGKEISSKNLKGKYYLLSFWATWCSPCIKKIPHLKEIRNKYSTENLEMISLSNDTDSTTFLKGLDKYKMNWLHVFNNAEMNNLYGLKPIPSLYLIDRNGKIIFSSWEKSMEELDSILLNELK